ncbi:Protein BZZ1, partial [Linderina pennispora]
MSFKFTAKAHLAYTKSKPDEVGLTPGDTLNVTNDEHGEWWVGVNTTTGESGWFPANYVSKVEEHRTPPPARRPKKPKRMARALQSFEAVEDDDLALQPGDIVEIIQETDGWCLGKNNGSTGMFPADFVEEIASEPAAHPLPPIPPRAATTT